MKATLSRRAFLRHSTQAGAGLLFLPSLQSVRGAPANNRLNVALIGVGGRGEWFVDTMPSMANVVAMCDVNEARAGKSFQKLPQVKKFTDFRRMLDEMKEIEAVVIATPDHTHATIAATAMRMGKHVYCEKPLTRTIHEARALGELAASQKVATQMGNQGTSSEAFRRATELIQAGVLGEIKEVHVWNDGGGAGQRPRPQDEQPVPPTLQWDLWLGPAAERPFHSDWLKWHTWRDFATGQLGNWSVHSANLGFKALKLVSLWHPGTTGADAPPERIVRVQSEVSERHGSSFPKWERVHFHIPARGALPPVVVHWHNGRNNLGSREQIEEHLGRKLDWGDAGEKKWKDHAGIVVVGSKGKIHATGHNMDFTLLPADQWRDFKGPEPVLPRTRGHEMEWLDACKGGKPAWSNFTDYGSPLTQFVLLGNVATQVEGELRFDAAAGKFLENDAANALVKPEYRTGWTL
jgi:hypothetical protein